MPPPAVNTPTTCHSLRPTRMLEPTSSPANSAAAPAPTATSFRPHSIIRPRTILTLSRTLNAGGSTPRSGTFASVPVERLGRLMMTNSSADASAPSEPRATPVESAITRVSSRDMPLTISLSDPPRSTRAVSGEPDTVIARRNPCAMESTPTNTATTPAIPNTASATAPRRWGMVNKPNFVTEAVCEIQLNGPPMSGPPQGVGYAQAHRLQRRQRARRQAQREDKHTADQQVARRQVECSQQ